MTRHGSVVRSAERCRAAPSPIQNNNKLITKIEGRELKLNTHCSANLRASRAMADIRSLSAPNFLDLSSARRNASLPSSSRIRLAVFSESRARSITSLALSTSALASTLLSLAWLICSLELVTKVTTSSNFPRRSSNLSRNVPPFSLRELMRASAKVAVTVTCNSRNWYLKSSPTGSGFSAIFSSSLSSSAKCFL